jgi:DMSO/TMAO reductase YedYZ heme-binding membrane subunit
VVFVGIHVLTSVLDTFVSIGWVAIVVPFTSTYDRLWVGVGTVGLDVLMAVFISSLLRARMRTGLWRGVHWLAYLCWPVALAHTFGMGTDSGEPWVIALGVLCVASVGAGLLRRQRYTAQQQATATGSPGPGLPRKHLALTRAGSGSHHDD